MTATDFVEVKPKRMSGDNPSFEAHVFQLRISSIALKSAIRVSSFCINFHL